MRRVLSVALLAVLLGAAVLGLCACASGEDGAPGDGDMPTGGTRLLALNIGKADCLLLFIGDKTYLIDTGWEHTCGVLAEALRQYNVANLDGVFLTHCHKDHQGGLTYLAQSDIGVGAWYASPYFFDVKPDKHPLVLAAAARGQAVTWLNAGDCLEVSQDASITVLGPIERNAANENNNSLVLYADTPDGTLLLAADMKLEQEATLFAAGVLRAADVLKVGHHGDDGATGDALVQTAQPQIALISTSTAQEADTPAPSVIKRLQRNGAEVYVTQEHTHGLMVTLSGGRATARDVAWQLPPMADMLSLRITLPDDLLVIRNAGDEPVDLTGYALYSSRGENCALLPQGAYVPANGVYKVGTRATRVDVDFSVDVNRLWHASRFDQATLYDQSGRAVAVTDNGIAE